MTERVSFTEEADRDLIDIYLYGLNHFGLRQTEKYADTLAAKLATIAENPGFGNDYGEVRAGVRRYESVSHSIYYRQITTGILVLRILHSRMDPARHV